MTNDVFFEKKIGDGWQPTRSSDCQPGDTIRMRQADGTILGGEGVVSAKNSTDPDSKRSFDIGLDYLGG